MFGEVKDTKGNGIYLIWGIEETQTEAGYEFYFPDIRNRPKVGMIVTMDYEIGNGEPFWVNCWDEGEMTWMVVNLFYRSPEQLGFDEK